MSIVFRLYDDERGTFGALRAADRWLRTALRACAAGDVAAAEDAVRRARKLLNAAWERARDNEPDRKSGAKARAGASAGGRAKQKGPTDAVLAAEVRALHDKNPRLSWATCCARVGQRYGLSRRTVEMRARAADWRAR